MKRDKIIIRIMICILELLLIVNIIGDFMKPRTAYSLYTEDMQSQGAVEVNLDGRGWYIDNSIELQDKVFLKTKGVDLVKGSYNVILHYQSGGEGILISFDSENSSYRLTAGRKNMRLADGGSGKIYELYLTENQSGVYIEFLYEGYGYGWISSVDIMQTYGMERVNLFYCLLIIIILEIIWHCIAHNTVDKLLKDNEKCKVALTIICLGVPVILSSLPDLFYYVIDGFDLNFHLMRIEGIAEALKGGSIPARIQTNWLNGYGYSVSVFYGDFLLYIPAFLRMLGMPLQSAYKVFVFLINVLTGMTMYLAAKNMTKSRKMGIYAGYFYLLMPYRLSCLYVRAGVGEYCSMVFFPLIIWGLYQIYTLDPNSKKWKWIWIMPAFGYFGVINSHLISTVIVGVVTIISCIILYKATFEKERFIALVKVVMATIIMSAGYLIPLLDYMGNDYNINDASYIEMLQTKGAFFSQILTLFPKGSNLSAWIEDYLTYEEEMVFSLGIIAWMGIALFLIYYIAAKRENAVLAGHKRGERTAIFVILGMGILSMIMGTDIFPWDAITAKLGDLGYLITKIQFPWRYLSVASALLVLGVIMVMNSKTMKKMVEDLKLNYNYYRSAGLLCVVFAIISAGYFTSEIIVENDALYIVGNSDLQTSNLQGEEYVPAGVDVQTLIAKREPEGKNIVLIDYYSEQSKYFVFVEETQNDNMVSIPKMYYDGYEAKIKGNSKWIKCQSDEMGRVAISLPQGYEGEVCVVFREPWYWRAAELISVISLLGATGYFTMRKRYLYNEK